MKSSILQRLSGPALAGVLMTVAPLLFSSALTYYTVVNETRISGFNVWEWVAITVCCCLTSAIALTPPTFLALVFGYFLSWNALAPLFALNMGAILLVNLLIIKIDGRRVLDVITTNKSVTTVLENIRQRELAVIFFTKLSPVLPFAVTNLVFALSGAKLRNILLGGTLGMIPRTVLAVWTGSQAREIKTLLENPNEGSWAQITIIGLILVSVVGLWLVLKRALSR
ncbi:TVP38/TMEM64 family protein [Tellurirhabdus bombi]|uniref:TVP38/TMEM64 family protein n=1 Tax=Tellurirhabdus bombi TaxID=2907205 RepID=UPI001F4770E9|nr:VTT domain-containing protein [Tellurirhabdus bombi]